MRRAIVCICCILGFFILDAVESCNPKAFAYLNQDERGSLQQGGLDCDSCVFVLELAEKYLHSQDRNETRFHEVADAACFEMALDDQWAADYCMYEIDMNIWAIYDALVMGKAPQQVCQELGYCATSGPEAISSRRPKRTQSSVQKPFPQDSNPDDDDWYTVAVISDPHIGQHSDTAYTTWLLQEAVKKINAQAEAQRIRLVVVTGDVTDSAMDEMWSEAFQVLEQLTVPYIPTLGNHDVWRYNNSRGDDGYPESWEEAVPTGDAHFASTFAKRLLPGPVLPGGSVWTYNKLPCHNPVNNITSWFQNWELQIPASGRGGGNLVLWGLDWNSRSPAYRSLGYLGAMPNAELFDFEGGTLPWWKDRLDQLVANVTTPTTAILMQHHPLLLPPVIPGWFFSFSDEQKQVLAQLMSDAQQKNPLLSIWGVVAGHLHVWYNGSAEMPLLSSCQQWLTEGCKVSSAYTLFRVTSSGKPDSFQRFYGFDA